MTAIRMLPKDPPDSTGPRAIKPECPHCKSNDQVTFMFSSGGCWWCDCCAKVFKPQG